MTAKIDSNRLSSLSRPAIWTLRLESVCESESVRDRESERVNGHETTYLLFFSVLVFSFASNNKLVAVTHKSAGRKWKVGVVGMWS